MSALVASRARWRRSSEATDLVRLIGQDKSSDMPPTGSLQPTLRREDLFDLGRRPSAGVEHWTATVESQLHRVRAANRALIESHREEQSSGGPATSQLHADVHFLLIAARQVRRYTFALQPLLTGAPDLAARASEALRAFDRQAGWVANVRDVYEHLDEYVLGTGRRQRRQLMTGRASPVLISIDGPPELLIALGEERFAPIAAAQPAVTLGATVAELWSVAQSRAIETTPEPDDVHERAYYMKVDLSVSNVIVFPADGREVSLGTMRGMRIEPVDDRAA